MEIDHQVKCGVEVKVIPAKKPPLNNTKIEPKEVSNNPQNPNPPTAEEKVGQIKNQLTIIDENAKEQRNQIINNLLSQILQASAFVTNINAELKRLQELLTKNKIDFIPPPPKDPNRAQRRKEAGITKQKQTTR